MNNIEGVIIKVDGKLYTLIITGYKKDTDGCKRCVFSNCLIDFPKICYKIAKEQDCYVHFEELEDV